MQRLAICRNGIAEPAEIRWLAYSVWIMPKRIGSLEISSAQGDPDAPCERTITVKDGNLDETANEKVLVIDYALIAAQFASLFACSRRKLIPGIRSIKVPREWRCVEHLATAGAFELSVHFDPFIVWRRFGGERRDRGLREWSVYPSMDSSFEPLLTALA
jgi:hypothetical protein